MIEQAERLDDFRDAEMSRLQVLTVGICLVINMMDGFDVLAIAFAAPSIAADWNMAPADLGILFSSGLAGMTLGSLILGPMADHYGRRPMILGCLVVISLGMLFTAFSQNLWQMAALRLITGLGIGGMLASINTLVAEYASHKRREFCISILQSGYPIGATIGGTISAFLIAQYDWRAVFIFGGLASTVMIGVAWKYLVESVDYLQGQGSDKSIAQAQHILNQMGMANGARSMAPTSVAVEKFNFAVLFNSAFLNSTIRIWLAFFCAMFTFYFAVNWTPKLLVDMGLPVDQGISAGVLMNVGGILGGLFLGYVSYKWDVRRLVALYMSAAFIMLTLFGVLDASVVVLLSVAFVIGFFLFGAMIGLYTIVPQIYSADIRSFGTGWAIGMGRIGGVVGPLVAGGVIASGLDPSVFFIVLSLPILLAGVAILNIRMK